MQHSHSHSLSHSAAAPVMLWPWCHAQPRPFPSHLPRRSLLQVAVVSLLQHHIAALEQHSSISLARSRWLFALAARLETPVHADTAAAFRSMHRRCVTWRAAVSSPQEPALPLLNVLIAVGGAYFKQDEGLAGLVQQLDLDLG